jgi:hypothetical protein
VFSTELRSFVGVFCDVWFTRTFETDETLLFGENGQRMGLSR